MSLRVNVDKKPKGWQKFILKWNWAIITFLVILLLYLSFKIGSFYACTSGVMLNGVCVQPVKVATVSVCEYNNYDCTVNCADVIVNDVRQFCETYNYDTGKWNYSFT